MTIEELRQRIGTVVNYGLADELHDALVQIDEQGDAENHIVYVLLDLSDFIGWPSDEERAELAERANATEEEQ